MLGTDCQVENVALRKSLNFRKRSKVWAIFVKLCAKEQVEPTSEDHILANEEI